jgi:hypothetical protein
MTVFANKDAFQGLGMEEVQASVSHASQDCSICDKPLAVHHNDASPKSRLHGYHDAVRIVACGHMHGKECLDAWLDVGNACPKCNRILFELTGDPITEHDINNVVRALGPMYGEMRVNIALVGMMQNQEQKLAALRRVHEQEVAQQKMKDAKGYDEGFMLNDEDLMDSDEEIDFEVDDEDGDEDEDGDVDGEEYGNDEDAEGETDDEYVEQNGAEDAQDTLN